MLPDDTKPLHKPMETSHLGTVAFTWERFTADAQITNLYNDFESYASKIIATSRVNELTDFVPCVNFDIALISGEPSLKSVNWWVN